MPLTIEAHSACRVCRLGDSLSRTPRSKMQGWRAGLRGGAAPQPSRGEAVALSEMSEGRRVLQPVRTCTDTGRPRLP
jgi:hypothetical protein